MTDDTVANLQALQNGTISSYVWSGGSGTSLETAMPNQCWKGYYNKSVFDSSTKPSSAQFRDFGVSVRDYGCAVCCCIGATNYLNGTNLTVEQLYNRKGFVWNPNKKSLSGRSNGPTLAKWKYIPGVNIINDNTKYDYNLTYAFCNASNKYQYPTYYPEDARLFLFES